MTPSPRALLTWLLLGRTTFEKAFLLRNLTLSLDPRQLNDQHPFVPEGPNDLRGPCPGMNLLANHNYIPHNGIASVDNTVAACVQGLDFCIVATALGFAYATNPLDFPLLTYSIGGPPPGSGGILGSITGQAVGLSGTHNQFESDASATRCDLDECGDSHTVDLRAFQALLDLVEAGDPTQTINIMTQHHVNRQQYSIANNPYYFHGPVQMIISGATTQIIGQFFTDYSEEYSDCYFTIDTLCSMFGVQRYPNGTLDLAPGGPRFPDGYRRPRTPVNLIPDMLANLIEMWISYPETMQLGGNLGAVNSFFGLDISEFTNGVYTATSLLQGDNAACFVYQVSQQLMPVVVKNVEEAVYGLLESAFESAEDLFPALVCPELSGLKIEMLEQYPGYNRSMN
ncbi:Chloroperoxidase [Mycena galopus ATCC 62051]|nr:Chloroperoxidase [Mycena galopus ATCC 62051]